MRLKARGPAGIFTIPTRGDAKYLFISAGTGITPSLSMTNYLYDRGLGTDVVLISCARRPAEIICRRRLEMMASRVPSIKLHFIVEEEDLYDAWTGYRGRLNQLMLGLIASDYLERKVYCCGPEPFMQAVRDMLIALGYDMERYHQESFALAVETAADAPALDDFVPDEGRSAEIVFADAGVTAVCNEGDTVLIAAKAAGLNIPNGCNFGVCGTCKIRKTAGEVHMVHNGGISEEDIAEGYILACCSRPIGRIEVSV
jgi:ferredoxin-NADP reductase